MYCRRFLIAGLLLAAWPTVGWCYEEGTVATAVDYARDVRPLLLRHCTMCHGACGRKPVCGSIRGT